MSEDQPCGAPHPAYCTPCNLPAGHGNAHEGHLQETDSPDAERIAVIWLAPLRGIRP